MQRIIDKQEVCDYKISEKCDGTLKGRNGTIHKGYLKPSDYPDKPNIQRACIDCEMCFDED